MKIRFSRVDWEYSSVFRIAYRTATHAETVLVELEDQGRVGRGEAMGVNYHNETVDSMLDQLACVADLGCELSRSEVLQLLPPGGARNAVDCALWDLEAKRLGCRAWELAGLSNVHPLTTAYTLGVDTPEAMARAAAAAHRYSLLKLKLMGDGDVERVAAVRQAHSQAQIIVDANQSWSENQLHEFTPHLADLGVSLIEQPLPVGKDDALVDFRSPVPLCADESCQTTESLGSLKGKYQLVNIKLDKTGGLTEALNVAHAARGHGFKLMVGCMGGSSLAMAPAFIVGQLCEVIDLDGPLLAKRDVPHPVQYDGSRMSIPESELWG